MRVELRTADGEVPAPEIPRATEENDDPAQRRRGAVVEFDGVLHAAQAGASWAVERLYEQHQPRLLRYLRARAGQDGDDVASQTWIDAARNLRQFSGDEDQFRRWLYTIANRRLADRVRHRARRPASPVPVEQLADRAAADDVAGAVVDRSSGDEAARRIAALLPASQAEVVLLRVVAGMTVDEVAALTGRRPGTVRVLAHRGLRRLARVLGETL